jgi:flagellin-like protein
MKGISEIIAILLMLVITIGLAGLAYAYISGFFTGRTAVVLAVSGESVCQPGTTDNAIIIWIRNDGTSTSSNLTWTNVPDNPNAITTCTFNPTTIGSGVISTVTCTRAAAGTGYWRVRISAPSANAITPSVYCSS